MSQMQELEHKHKKKIKEEQNKDTSIQVQVHQYGVLYVSVEMNSLVKSTI